MSLLSTFYNKDVVENAHYKFSPSGAYTVPPKGDYQSYVDFIKVWPSSAMSVGARYLCL